MEILLVGGAVRDQLLGIKPRERDWVVVGANPEQLIDLGYKQVGKEFPVFLHPKTQEEYALARTERKSGAGYTGFICDFGEDVTLEQDLVRRDLTVNAMAETADGEIIDPYGGQQDLKAKILRHVSPAFTEDPLRVLRVARFKARYHHLGFTIAPETLALMREIAHSGELNALVPERVWQEIQSALMERSPAEFIATLHQCGALSHVLPEVDRLFGIPQTTKYHPEIDTGVHLLLAMEMVSQLSDDAEVRFAVLVHDLGKGVTPRELWPSHRGHEEAGVPLIEEMSKRLKVPNAHTQLARLVSRHHLQCHRAFELNPATILRLFRNLDVYRRADRFQQFLLACEADARGRKGLQNQPYEQSNYLQNALHSLQAIKPTQTAGLSGKEIGEQVEALRLLAITQYVKDYRQANGINK